MENREQYQEALNKAYEQGGLYFTHAPLEATTSPLQVENTKSHIDPQSIVEMTGDPIEQATEPLPKVFTPYGERLFAEEHKLGSTEFEGYDLEQQKEHDLEIQEDGENDIEFEEIQCDDYAEIGIALSKFENIRVIKRKGRMIIEKLEAKRPLIQKIFRFIWGLVFKLNTP